MGAHFLLFSGLFAINGTFKSGLKIKELYLNQITAKRKI
jgi:hypothetical protein